MSVFVKMLMGATKKVLNKNTTREVNGEVVISVMCLINRMKERSNGAKDMSMVSGQSRRMREAKQMPSDKNVFGSNK